MEGGDGDDVLTGGGGTVLPDADTIRGGNGHDRLYGGPDADLLYGDAGIDILYGGDGNDYLNAGAGGIGPNGPAPDQLFGEWGNDVLDGGVDADRLSGGYGDDDLAGGGGNDTLLGEDGADTLTGGAGENRLEGGTGNDRYYQFAADGPSEVVDTGGTDYVHFWQVTVDQLLFFRFDGDGLNGDELAIFTAADAADGSVDNPVMLVDFYAGGPGTAGYIEYVVDSTGTVYSLDQMFAG